MENFTINDLSASESLVEQSIENSETSTINEVEVSIEDGSIVSTLTSNEIPPGESPIEDQATPTVNKPSSKKCPQEKSAIYWDILTMITSTPETDHWLAKYCDITSYQPYALFDVPEHTAEFSSVAGQFRASFRFPPPTLKIKRIECPYLLGLFLMKREKLSNARTMTLYHGTSNSALDVICKLNFNWRKTGTARGHKFGQGVSFSPKASYSQHFTPDNVIIRSQVLVGRDTVGSSDTKIPPESYDTTTNGKGTVYVKYEDDDFYPEYIIYFS